MEDYHILERIGEGSFGKVYRGRRKYSGQIVALKFVSKRGKNAKDLHNLREEVTERVCLLRLFIYFYESYEL
jgi:fused-like protein